MYNKINQMNNSYNNFHPCEEMMPYEYSPIRQTLANDILPYPNQNMPHTPKTMPMQKTLPATLPKSSLPEVLSESTQMPTGLPQAPTGMPTGPSYSPPVSPIEDDSDFMPIGPAPLTVMDPLFTQGYLKTQIGKTVKVEFLLGTGMLIDRDGTLVGVGNSYILIQEFGTNDIVLCDMYSIKFVKFIN